MKPALFQPTSVFWLVNREMACALAGPRAVLMQIAHPLVAAGVANHSRYREARFGRLYRTAMAAAAITFCSKDLAHRAIRSIDRKHLKVHGVLSETAGVFPAGTPYDANDAELKLWVLATITDSTILAYELFVKPLSMTEQEEFYRDSLLLSKLFGVPDSIVPQTYSDFQTYMKDMLDGDVIRVSNSARDIAHALFAPTLAGRALYAGSVVGIGLMPDRLKREFGLTWSPRRERWLQRSAQLHRSVRKHTPAIFCASPVATFSELMSGFDRQFAALHL
ncbi:MAG TPA: oxygenase MpaB family protein [Terriglobia bacterium]|nr:oxygenase MpaB family protein [Terriglobia bacterium]